MDITRPQRTRFAARASCIGAGALALAVCACVLAAESPAQPAATMDEGAALKIAQRVAAQVKGAQVVAVQPNGSMRPIFEEKAFLLVAPASYESLCVGDIVTFNDPASHTVVVQRILEKRGDTLRGPTDRAGSADSTAVPGTREVSRVFAIIYANGSAQAGPVRR